MEHYYRLTLYRKDTIVNILDIHQEVDDVRRSLSRLARELMWKQEGTFIFQSYNGYINCCYTDVTGYIFVRM